MYRTIGQGRRVESAFWRASAVAFVAAWLSGCAVHSTRYSPPPVQPQMDGPPPRVVDLRSIPDATPRKEPLSAYGNPDTYTVYGREYRTFKTSAGYVERGIASWYGKKFHGRKTSSGEPYDMYTMTAAHKHLPLPTYARVTNLENGRSIVVRINDRGPFHDNRLIDLSYVAAAKLGILAKGTGLVEIEAIDPAAPPKSAARTTIETKQAVAKPGLYLQVGAFSNRVNAEAMRKRLSHIPAPVNISPLDNPQDQIFRVRVGPLQDAAEADRLASTIGALGLQPYVIVE